MTNHPGLHIDPVLPRAVVFRLPVFQPLGLGGAVGVDGHPQEPRPDVLLAFKLFFACVVAQQGFLCRVLGVGGVAADLKRRREQTVTVGFRQHLGIHSHERSLIFLRLKGLSYRIQLSGPKGYRETYDFCDYLTCEYKSSPVLRLGSHFAY